MKYICYLAAYELLIYKSTIKKENESVNSQEGKTEAGKNCKTMYGFRKPKQSFLIQSRAFHILNSP